MRDDQNHAGKRCLRIAAAGDLHCAEQHRAEIADSIAALSGTADLVLLAGDLTTHGEPEQGAVLADACASLDAPVFAVLGNHDWHANRRDELVAALATGGIRVLDRDWAVCEAGGLEVGIVRPVAWAAVATSCRLSRTSPQTDPGSARRSRCA